ncbi:MAG: NAD(P)-dependent oxidoreductase [Chloroflexi bacterium]|nr:NAD(P)-dependent oxidoreductase [Chloroflexota bacterium]
MKVLVTGGSGRAGRYIIPELRSHGHEVVSTDRVPDDSSDVSFMRIDTTDLGAVISVSRDMDAIVHMSAIPNPGRDPEAEVFRVNMLSNWNVLEAAEIHGINKVVMASSVNAVGAIYSHSLVPPHYFPIDEEHPTRAEDAYSQSKWLGEEMAEAFCRRRPMQIASMRFHGLMDVAGQQKLKTSGGKTATPFEAMHFWGWVDIRDAARSCRLALEVDWTGHEAFFINGDETSLSTPTMEAIEQGYPGVKIRKPLEGTVTALDITKAENILGWKPEYHWRDA